MVVPDECFGIYQKPIKLVLDMSYTNDEHFPNTRRTFRRQAITDDKRKKSRLGEIFFAHGVKGISGAYKVCGQLRLAFSFEM
jgi:hypothetical protein